MSLPKNTSFIKTATCLFKAHILPPTRYRKNATVYLHCVKKLINIDSSLPLSFFEDIRANLLETFL